MGLRIIADRVTRYVFMHYLLLGRRSGRHHGTNCWVGQGTHGHKDCIHKDNPVLGKHAVHGQLQELVQRVHSCLVIPKNNN